MMKPLVGIKFNFWGKVVEVFTQVVDLGFQPHPPIAAVVPAVALRLAPEIKEVGFCES